MVTVIQSRCELCAVPCMVERRGTLCVYCHSMGVHCVYMVTVWGYSNSESVSDVCSTLYC